MAKVAIAGLGATGSFIAQRFNPAEVEGLHIYDSDQAKIEAAKKSIHPEIEVSAGPIGSNLVSDVVILATPAGSHLAAARAALEAGSHVVSLCDNSQEVKELLALDAVAVSAKRCLVIGAGLMPGLTCLLTSWASKRLDVVESINVLKVGTAGPACARQHHRALKATGWDWTVNGWLARRGGSGRELAWFPNPIGARDCYRGDLPSPLLLHKHYPTVSYISARMSATRRDRLTSRLPMLKPPYSDGGLGAARVELSGLRKGIVETVILGVLGYPSMIASTVAVASALEIIKGRVPIGANGLAAWSDPGSHIANLQSCGVRVSKYSG